MKLTLEKKNLVKVYNSDFSVVVNLTGSTQELSADDATLVGDFDADAITKPGEYEFGTHEVIAVETKEVFNNTADLFKVMADGVKVLFQLGDVKDMKKRELDTLGAIDVLVVNPKLSKDKTESIIKKLSPSVMVVVDYDKDQVAKDFDVEVKEEQKTIKFDTSDFKDSDSSLYAIGLTK